MSRPLVSVIVPVYEPGPYLLPCLESIRAQSMTDLEVILVDNGCTDDSPRLCEEFAAADPRFRVIHQENRGALGGRGRGFADSQGEYISFIDCDDVVRPDFLELLLHACRRTGLPCACCQVSSFTDLPPQTSAPGKPSFCRFDAPAHLNALLHDGRVLYSLCNKLYHRSLLEGAEFSAPVAYNEDLFLNWKVLQKADGLALLDAVAYDYRQRSSSASHRPPSDKLFEDQLAVARMIETDCRSTELEASGWSFYYEKLLYLNSMILRRRDAHRYAPRHKALVQQLRQELGRALRCPALSPVLKLTALLSCWGGPFYRLLCRLLLTDRR